VEGDENVVVSGCVECKWQGGRFTPASRGVKIVDDVVESR
jgi:hypothetical protein